VEMTLGDLYTTCLLPCLTVEISCFEFQQRFVLLCNDKDPDSFWKFGSGLELYIEGRSKILENILGSRIGG
jgi:hypothetical protein